MTNLLKETEEILTEHNLSNKDVLWVGSRDLWTAWDNFKAVANVDYDSGYGVQEVMPDLLIVGKYWWLERHEYDGLEWWEFKQLPERPDKNLTIKAVVRSEYEDSLLELNQGSHK